MKKFLYFAFFIKEKYHKCLENSNKRKYFTFKFYVLKARKSIYILNTSTYF